MQLFRFKEEVMGSNPIRATDRGFRFESTSPLALGVRVRALRTAQVVLMNHVQGHGLGAVPVR